MPNTGATGDGDIHIIKKKLRTASWPFFILSVATSDTNLFIPRSIVFKLEIVPPTMSIITRIILLWIEVVSSEKWFDAARLLLDLAVLCQKDVEWTCMLADILFRKLFRLCYLFREIEWTAAYAVSSRDTVVWCTVDGSADAIRLPYYINKTTELVHLQFKPHFVKLVPRINIIGLVVLSGSP